MKPLTVGQMARINHVSEQTLRLYDKMGLLSPISRGDENGYRYYSIRQSAILGTIQYLKSLGMSLKEIQELRNEQDFSFFCHLLESRDSCISEQIQNLQCQQRAIRHTIQNFERYKNSPPDGSILLEHIEKRFIYCSNSGVNFYECDTETYEQILHNFKNSFLAEHLPLVYFCNVGTILRKENLLQNRFVSTEFFVFVDEALGQEAAITEIPAGNYLCIYCSQYENEIQYAKRLLAAAEQQGMEIVGDYLCEALIEWPIMEESARKMFLRLQVPVLFR